MPPSARDLYDLGCRLKRDGELPQAEFMLRAAHAADPADPLTRHALGVVLLSQGRYAEGWPFYDARHERPETGNPKPALPFPEWRGEPLAGKRLLIWHEQGLGDEIMYARFAPWAARQGAEVTLLCARPLERLFATLDGVAVVAASGQVDIPDPDVWVMSSSIAGRAGVSRETLPAAPYLSAVPVTSAARIGVVTRGGARHANDANRSLPDGVAARLLALPGTMSLAPEDTGARDFADTAAIVAGLDLVISVDTSTAHLAGALGKPVWILISRVLTDWRWGDPGPASPWYPSARLYWQDTPGDWRGVVERVCADAARL